MLIQAKGNCSKCGCAFGQLDTLQSTNVECSKCKVKIVVCKSCKLKGCKCGGRLLDPWDKNPKIMF